MLLHFFVDELDKRGYYDQMKTLVENMYQQNGRQKVTIVAHSMGGPVTLYFLTSYPGVDQSWKNKYINAWVTLSGAWSGGVPTIPVVVTGTSKTPLFLKFFDDLISNFLVPVTRTFESLSFLFPKASVFGNSVLISTPSREYTANDYKQLFSDIGYTNGYKMFQGVQKLNQGYPSPNVHTYCYYGVNVKTPVKYTYDKDFKRDNTVGLRESSVQYGDGDGAVNTVSSEVCHKWTNMPSSLYSFTYRKYSKVNHDGIVKNTRVLADIAAIVRAPPPTSHLSV